MRNPNPFTNRQIRLIEAIRERIRQINDPAPEVITDEDYEFHVVHTKEFGSIPKIRFRPNCSQIKSELIENAELIDHSRERELNQIRQKYGIKAARNSLARLFESEWNNTMLKIKKATFTLALINQLFATQNQAIAEPIRLMQSIVMEEYTPKIKTKRQVLYEKEITESGDKDKSNFKGYGEELMEIE